MSSPFDMSNFPSLGTRSLSKPPPPAGYVGRNTVSDNSFRSMARLTYLSRGLELRETIDLLRHAERRDATTTTSLCLVEEL